MANPLKSEVQFQAGEDTYTLAFPINSIIALEENLGFGVVELGPRFEAGIGMGVVRSMFWAGLIANHNVTEDEAGEIIDQVGIEASAELVGRALTLAMPGAGGGKGKARPQTAAGTGKRS